MTVMVRPVLLWGLVAAAGTALVVWALRPAAVPVETAPVTTQTFRAVIEADGRTRVRERFVVSAPIAARVERLSLKPGDTVTAGQTVAALRPNAAPLLDPRTRRELEERLGAADAQVDEARALQARAGVVLAQARTDLERAQRLRERGVVTQATLDRDTTAVAQAERDQAAAERRVHATEHVRAQAIEALRRSEADGGGEAFVVTAPTSGVVLRVVQESEAAVQPGTPLIEVGDPADLDIVADLVTTDAVQVRPGARVEIVRWGGAQALEGRVRRVEPSGFTKVSALGVEEQRVWVVADLVSPPADRPGLGDGFRTELRFVVDEIEGATVVPVGALFRRGDAWQVFVMEAGIARLRTVRLRQRSGPFAAVADGLSAGETVILFPPNAVRDGARVRPLAP